eukprot:CCRYP_018403-RA/>CCRYP_018403-RA protein AED:0.65 eAED:0.23 QI:0/0/0/1/1/1/2/0/799
MAAVQKLEYAYIAANFGTLAPLIGRPNVHSIRHLENQCITKAMAIANPAAPNMGYAGIFMNRGEYAMSAPTPYVNPPNPGATPNYNVVDNAGQLRFLNDNDRAIIKAQHAADLVVWSNHEIVQRVIKEALDRAIPEAYKPSLGIGQRGFGNRSVQDIFTDLYNRYGTVTPADIKNLTLLLYKEWNPSTPIEAFLLNIETQQVFATKAGRPFHTYLLIEAALSVIKDTRQFKDELREYNRLHPDPTLIQWHQFKRFWIEKHAEYERDRTTMQDAGYHGANNTEEDSNSLASLTEAFTTLHSQRTQQDLALQTLLQEVSSLRQLINNTQGSTTQIPTNIQFPPHPPSVTMYPPQPPPYSHHTQPTAPPLIHHMPATPVHMPPPPPTLSTTQPYTMPPPPPTMSTNQPYNTTPTPQHYGSRTRTYRNNTNRGRGRNNSTTSGQRNNPPHPIKRYNNWWYCYSCGFDTPYDGTSCTRQVPGHIAHLTRDQKIAVMHLPVHQQQYRTASHAGHHKRFLPSQAAANGYPHHYDYTPTPTNYNTICNNGDDDDDTTVITSNCSSRHPPPSDAATTSSMSPSSSGTTNSTPSTANTINIALATTEAIADSGATAHFLLPNVPINNKRHAEHPLNITLPDGEVIQSTHVGNLNLPGLGDAATLAHVVPGLAHSSLLSIKQLCDNGCHVIFTKKDCKVYRKAELMLEGKRHPATGLWVVPTSNHKISAKPNTAFTSHAAHNAYQTSSRAKLVQFLHQCAFSPPPSTWIKAINNNQFSSWPGLTADAVRRYLPDSTATAIGHMKKTPAGV